MKNIFTSFEVEKRINECIQVYESTKLICNWIDNQNNIGRFISENNNQFECPSTKHILLLKECYKNVLIMAPVDRKTRPIDVSMNTYTRKKKIYEFLLKRTGLLG